ncbi:hypothetical protein [Janthinobacterium sp. 17J80-10]|uniref:hypothetical protein n=1 Tax=Janthinobacterium sp. 17J80-10 TaxID=2497863 RepID=UPI0010058418|nr:hypothetical protein [Janthinobacterium sp. 17J80-10]QAU34945.1 hypothetical protein EKL02_12555 [Janthinobacterium sp. 17J80-10]
MSTLKIKDLSDSIDLDRKAMLAIAGGARRSGAALSYNPRSLQTTRLVNFPGGLTGIQLLGRDPRKLAR